MPRSALRMPKMSMTMEEGELVSWKVAVGDTVQEGDVVCEVLTDKVDMEVEATASGTVVGIDVTEGATVPVGTPLAWIESESDSLLDDLVGGSDDDTDATPPAAPTPHPAPAPPAPASAPVGAPAGAPATGILPAMPAARRLAATSGLELAAVPGSGPGRAVMVSDVLRALTEREAANAAAAPAPTPPPTPTPTPGVIMRSGHPEVTGSQDHGNPVTAPAASTVGALHPRTGEGMSAPGAALWRDAVLGAEPDPAPELLRARVLVAVSAGLARSGPAEVQARPRVALVVPTVAGSVPLTFTAPHLGSVTDLARDVADATAQAASGRVDVRFLAPPDATVTWLDDVDRVLLPARPGVLVAIGLGAAAPRVVVTSGGGVGVRTTVSMSASADARLADPAVVARLLAEVAAALESPPR